MKFRTEYEGRTGKMMLDPEQPVVLLGSCFTDNIGERMRRCRWKAFPNITGTLYNPASIARILDLVCMWTDPFQVIEKSLVERDGLWTSWLTDSGCTTYSKSETKEHVFNRLRRLREKLSGASTLIVTFGTAWVYSLAEEPWDIVANCHKFPADTFERRRLSVDEIVGMWEGILSILAITCPNLKVIFTVSPVRHLKDGFEGNSRSKATLQLACEGLCHRHGNTDYFPSFEIMNDDLRDYRFYASDMVHPSEEAVEYIWEKFQGRYLSEASRALLKEGEKVTKRLNHRPIVHGDSEYARYMASRHELEAADAYNVFIAAHPGMLHVGE